MPSVLFAGGGLDSCTIVSGSPTEITTAGTFDNAYADRAINLATGTGQTVQYTQVDNSNAGVDLTSGQTGWYHLDWQTTGISSPNNTNYTYLVDSSGNPWLALRTSGSAGIFGIYYNSGTGGSPTWTALSGTTWTPTANALYTLDIRLTIGSPHTVEFYVNNTLTISGTFTQASLTSIRGLRAASATSNSASIRVSQVMITEGRSTINGKVPYKRATGAGGNTGWTGAASNVNEAISSDSTVDSTTTAGVRQSYVMGDVTVPSGYAIATVMHFLRAKNDGAAPANIKSVVRQSSTNYDYSTNMPGIGTGFAALPARYDTDPATGVAWTQSGFNSAEFGYLSAA